MGAVIVLQALVDNATPTTASLQMCQIIFPATLHNYASHVLLLTSPQDSRHAAGGRATSH